MKKKILLVMPLLAISLLASCGGSKIPDLPSDLDLYKKEYVRDPKTDNILETYEYEYNNKNLCIKMIYTTTEEPDFKEITEYAYDDYGNLVFMIETEYNKEQETSKQYQQHIYECDNQNRITQELINESDDNETWRQFERFTYEYKDNVTIKTRHGSHDELSSIITYTCDKKGNLINEKTIDYFFPSNCKEIVYIVDDYGCATSAEEYEITEDGARVKKTYTIETSYLSNLWYRPLKSVATPVDSSEDKLTTEYEYNDKKQIVSEKYYEGEGGSIYDYYSTYEY